MTNAFMIHPTRNQRKERDAEQPPSKIVGLQCFADFAKNKNYRIKPETYGFYEVIKKTKHKTYKSTREAIRASVKNKNGKVIKGWIIYFEHEKDFKPDGCGYIIKQL